MCQQDVLTHYKLVLVVIAMFLTATSRRSKVQTLFFYAEY